MYLFLPVQCLGGYRPQRATGLALHSPGPQQSGRSALVLCGPATASVRVPALGNGALCPSASFVRPPDDPRTKSPVRAPQV